ncbi:uncharacterized protein AB9W97_006640 [Spinachia spinachia]
MALHCITSETPTTASSCSTEPLYDNCPPFPQRGRAGEEEKEGRAACPAVIRPRGPCSPPPRRAPAVNEAPTRVGGGRGTGAWPDHSHRSWRGGLGRPEREAEPVPRITNTVRGGGRAGEWGGSWGAEDTEEHSSALSLYDNLPGADAPDSLPPAFDMETRIQEHRRGQGSPAWPPEHIQALTQSEAASDDKTTGIQRPDPERDPEHQRQPEPDSGCCGSKRTDSLQFQTSPPQKRLTVSSPQPGPTERRVPWPRADGQQPPRSPRAPPPVPPTDPSASALRCLLTSLQQQIGRQREEYEARILSLEQRNGELQAEVVRLTTHITQQRSWYHAVQAKIEESERRRAAAEIRNATLQKEMEQFLDTFGELNSEAKKTEYIVNSF